MDKSIKDKQQSKKISIILFVVSTIGILVGVGLVITLSLLNLTGIRTEVSFSLNNCSAIYYLTKYSNISIQLRILFLSVCLILALQFITCFYSLYYLLKQLKTGSFRQAFIYILVVLLILSSGISFGKCLVFYFDFKKMISCSMTYQQSSLIVLLALNGFLLLLALTQLVIFTFISSDIRQGLQDNYKNKEFYRKNQTEQNVIQKIFEKDETLYKNRLQKMQPMRPDSFNQQLYARYYPQREQITKENFFQKKRYQASYPNDYQRQYLYKQNNSDLPQVVDDLQKFDPANIDDVNGVHKFLSSNENEQKQQFSNSGIKFMRYFNVMHSKERQSEHNMEKKIKLKYGV